MIPNKNLIQKQIQDLEKEVAQEDSQYLHNLYQLLNATPNNLS